MKTVKIKGKDYVMVVERLKYLANDQDAPYSIETTPEFIPDLNGWLVKATLRLGDPALASKEHHTYVFTGHAFEVIGQGNINKTSALENAETSAVGRACAMAGIGLIDDVASANEVIAASDASEGQLLRIQSLIQTTILDDDIVGRIESRLHEFTYLDAKKTIQYLLENQLDPRDRGNMSAKEIREAVEAKLADEKA